ncbi:MFS transporter [Actinomycetes bacterium]|nr:MFS transporter [Actinomycetes bacterium]
MSARVVVRSSAALLAAAVIAQLSISALQQGLPALGPVLQQTFALQTSGTAALLGVGSLGTATAILFWGRLTDHTTDRLVALLGLLLTAVSLTIAGFAAMVGSLGGLVIGFVAAGVFAAAPTVALTKSIATAFQPINRMGLALGIRQSAVPLGASVAAIALPLIALRWGIAYALWSMAVALLIAALGVSRAVPGERRIARLDPLLPTPWAVIAPMLIASGLYTATQIGIVSLLSLYLVNARGWSTPAAAVVFAGVMVTAVVLRILLGLAIDRWPSWRLWTFKSIGFLTASLLVTAAITDPAPVAVFLIVSASVIGMGWNVVAFTLTISLVPHERVGTSQGVMNAIVFAAWGLSPIITGLLVQSFSWSVAWIALAFLAITGALIARTRSFFKQH